MSTVAICPTSTARLGEVDNTTRVNNAFQSDDSGWHSVLFNHQVCYTYKVTYTYE